MAVKKKAKRNDNRRRAPRNRNSVQPPVSSGERELDNREYGEGLRAPREKVLRDPEHEESEGTTERRTDSVEGAVSPSTYPPEPPPVLFECNDLLEAATAFWGLREGELQGKSRKTAVCWPRFVCCALLRAKGCTFEAIGEVFNRDHGTISNAVKQFRTLTELYPAYREQAKAFDRYCWSSTKKHKVGFGSA